MRLVFYLIILFLPIQLGRHFWPWWSYVSGLRIDYLSPTIYFTDVLIGVLFVLWLALKVSVSGSKSQITNHKSQINSKKQNVSNLKIWSLFGAWNLVIGIFLLALLTGILLSKNPQAGFYGLLKLLEFGFFGFYVANTLKKPQDLKIIAMLFSIGVLFESCLAIAQYVSQSSIGGMLYFLGERTFTSQTPGIANATLNGQLILRPYATFPHPNVLAGYLVVAMTLIIFNFQFSIFNQKSNIKKIIFSTPLILGTIALFLTMSRVAIFLWFIFILKSLIFNRKSLIGLLVVLVFIGSIFYSPLGFRFFDVTITDESIIRRKELIAVTLEMIKTSPVVGVGLMNFLPNLPIFQTMSIESLFTTIQPVHNIYLLVLAEAGIIGFCFFLWFLKKTYRRFNMILSIILVLGLFDHYFLTLQQGQLLLTFILGMAWANITFSSSTAVIFMKPVQAKHTGKI